MGSAFFVFWFKFAQSVFMQLRSTQVKRLNPSAIFYRNSISRKNTYRRRKVAGFKPVVYAETSYLHTDMCKIEPSQKESRALSADSSKA